MKRPCLVKFGPPPFRYAEQESGESVQTLHQRQTVVEVWPETAIPGLHTNVPHNLLQRA